MLIPALIIFIAIILLLFIRKQKENYTIVNLKRKKGDKEKMLELAKNFIDKECIIYTFNNSLIQGTIKEISKNALLLETGNTVEAVNLDFVVRIREYPRKKNGKKKSVVLD
ncbi:hypothetical protein DW115_02890 [Clostridium sp. AM09-51]|jgi:hypothetical protein|nr:hypothetical protein DW115_02890 [Clostridium sp. AM09-51]